MISSVDSTVKEMGLQATPVFSSRDTWSGFTIDQYLLPPGHVPEHTLERHAIMFNIGAPVSFSRRTPNGWDKCICSKGSVIRLLSCGEREEILWDNEHYVLNLALEPTFIDHLLGTEKFKFREEHNLQDAFLRDVALKLHQATEVNPIAEKMYLESIVISCSIHLATQYGADRKKIFAPKGKLSSRQLNEVIDYTHSFIHSNISLTELASTAHLSPYHFARLFRQTMGISPYQFVLQLKIEYAKRLIQNQGGSLCEIAYALNFTDQAHFSNVFKKITGVSPRTFLPHHEPVASAS
jgi:AraC family transcriptional regulator